MLRQVTAGLIGLAGVAFAAAPALALTSSAAVNVNITIAPTISIWADYTNPPANTSTDISLTLDGSNPPDNSQAVASGIGYINNVDARIDVAVTGSLPAPTVSGGGIQFSIFDGKTAAQALAAIHANQYAPAGGLTWNAGNLGTSKLLASSIGVNTSAVDRLITYAAALPGDLPLPGNWGLVATYTLTSPP
jgi:hypothetical protein